MSEHLFWYIARSSGLIGWALMAASVLWGLMMSSKVRPGGVRPAWMLDLHRYLGALAVIFTVVHVMAIVADTYTDFALTSVFVPFASAWRPGAVAWGVVSMYLLLAVELTSLARKKLPLKAWRMIHFGSLPLYVLSSVHLLTAGSEASNPIVRNAVWLISATVVALLSYRIGSARPQTMSTAHNIDSPRQRSAVS